MELMCLCGILLTGVFFQAVVAENDYKDFLISVSCPKDWGSLAEETIDCGPGAVIDIVSARVTLLAFKSLCEKTFDFIVDKIISDDPDPCNVELPFLLCHGNQKCIVDRSMANQSLPDCALLDGVGYPSDTLLLRYKCFTFENPIQLPSNQPVTESVIDILSSKSPEVNDYICEISPIEDSGNVSLMIDIKMANYPPGKSSVTIDLKQSDEDTIKLIPFKGDYEIRNKMYEEFGEEWTLFYHGDPELEKGKFWIQIKVNPAQATCSGDTPRHLQLICFGADPQSSSFLSGDTIFKQHSISTINSVLVFNGNICQGHDGSRNNISPAHWCIDLGISYGACSHIDGTEASMSRHTKGESSKEEKKKPKPKPKMGSPPKKCKIKVEDDMESYQMPKRSRRDDLARAMVGGLGDTAKAKATKAKAKPKSSDTAAAAASTSKGKGKGRGKPINIPLDNISPELKKILVQEMVKGGRAKVVKKSKVKGQGK